LTQLAYHHILIFMERFLEQTASDLAANYSRNRFREELAERELYAGNVNICQNCGDSCSHLTHVPEFDYMACETCLDEAIAILAKEAIQRKPAAIERMQGELFPVEVA